MPKSVVSVPLIVCHHRMLLYLEFWLYYHRIDSMEGRICNLLLIPSLDRGELSR